MTQDEIIEMARQVARQPERIYAPDEKEFLYYFAKLVAAKAIAEWENSLILTSEVNISNNFKQPQRTWVDLTDTQIENVYFEVVKEHRGAPMPWGQVQFGRALQDKLKVNNK